MSYTPLQYNTDLKPDPSIHYSFLDSNSDLRNLDQIKINSETDVFLTTAQNIFENPGLALTNILCMPSLPLAFMTTSNLNHAQLKFNSGFKTVNISFTRSQYGILEATFTSRDGLSIFVNLNQELEIYNKRKGVLTDLALTINIMAMIFLGFKVQYLGKDSAIKVTVNKFRAILRERKNVQ